MTTVRVLTQLGSVRFAQYLTEMKLGNTPSFDLRTLDHGPWSTIFEPEVNIEQKPFVDRMEMGKYLVERFELAGVDLGGLPMNKGLWSWVAAYWFDTICPLKSGSRRLRETARYVCSLDWRDYYRHLIGSTWLVFSRHGQYSRLLLHSPPDTHNDFMEQLASKQTIILNNALIESADRLYWDAKANRPKRNASNKEVAGNVRRFVSLVWQLELTWDVYSMSSDDILDLLPSEFDVWKG